MGDLVGGLMAVMGLAVGLMVGIAILLIGDAQNGKGNDSHRAPYTNHPGAERMVA